MSASRKRKNASLFLTAVLAGLGGVRSASATIFTDWNFDGLGAQAAPYNSPPTSLGTGTATPLGMTNSYTFNGNEGPGSVTSCDVLASAGSSSGAGTFAWRVRGPSNAGNGGAGQSNGWNSQAPIATQGAEFAAATPNTTDGNITVSFDVNVTTQAERNLALLYTLDDSVGSPVWADVTDLTAGSQGSVATNSLSANTVTGEYYQTSTTGTGWNNQISAVIAGAANDPNFAVELVNASTGTDDVNGAGNPLNNSSGNWRFDNITFSGTAVPEPASLGLLTLGALPLMSRRRKLAVKKP